MSKLSPYRSALSAGEMAAGMNAATRNANRLLEDAKLLLDSGRFPTACSVAILAIEEAGKVSVCREIATSSDDKELKITWRRYRNHRAKNASWIVAELVRAGARTLDDLRPIFDEDSDHPQLLDMIKQLGFYTDCYNRGHWSEPVEVIEEGLARSIVLIAEILCNSKSATSEREIELWIKHIGPHWGTPLMRVGLIEWHQAMIEEGLTDVPLQKMEKFIFGDEEQAITPTD